MSKENEKKNMGIENRYDFVYLFDVKDGNPNGDPDQGNLPRIDPETNHGLVTDVCIKRKVRNYIELQKKGKKGYAIFVKQGNILNEVIESAKGDKPENRQQALCQDYYDIRAFGAVLSTGKKPAGTVRGPLQFTFARSIDRILQSEHSITRQAVTTQEEAKKQHEREYASTMGRKFTIPYGLYLMKGFISATDAQKTNFSEEDLALLWDALKNIFDHDRSAARGDMNARALIVFKHDQPLGNARASDLFERVSIEKKADIEVPRNWSDYQLEVNQKNLPTGINIEGFGY